MSHIQGSDYVGSMVVLEDGLPNKREYRRFKVKDVPGPDNRLEQQQPEEALACQQQLLRWLGTIQQ